MTPSSFTRFMDDMIEEFNAVSADKQQTFNISTASMDAMHYSLNHLKLENQQAFEEQYNVKIVQPRIYSIQYAGYTFHFVEDPIAIKFE